MSCLLLSTPGRAVDEFDEDDFAGPLGEYGEFNEEAEEAAETRFYQYGRFFGISLGLNYEGATGNRGALWRGGFPGFDVRLHYWFDFNFAMDLGFYTAPHNFDGGTVKGGQNEVNVSFVGLNLKYYFDTKDLSSGISFANPYLLGGFGSYTKTETPENSGTTDKDSKFGIGAGAGLEFALSPRKTYFSLEGKIHHVRFKDVNSQVFAAQSAGGLENLNGLLYTFTGSFLFTW